MSLFKFFDYSEFDCACCGHNWTDIKLIQKLDRVREKLGSPIHVNSGYRCEKHNKEVGGKCDSQHVLGKAADVRADDMDKLYELLTEEFQAVGDGRKKGLIHIDLRSEHEYRWNY